LVVYRKAKPFYLKGLCPFKYYQHSDFGGVARGGWWVAYAILTKPATLALLFSGQCRFQVGLNY
ncbi:hypothetical protein, partial [Helicobacter rodentium]|uniref:hypothetical protein n=2 Tax=Helicobacter rodentium TaxID=59617 RepID=UPI0026298F19